MAARIISPGAIMTDLARDILVLIPRDRPRLSGIGPIAGISPQTLLSCAQDFPLATFTSLLEAAAREALDPTLGLKLGAKFDLASLGKLGQMMMAAPSVGEAIGAFVHHFALVQTNTTLRLSVQESTARLAYEITDPTVRCREQDENFTLAMVDGMFRTLLGARWRPVRVDVAHQPGDDLAAYQRHFNAPLRFGATQNALVFASPLLTLPPREAASGVYHHLKSELGAELSTQLRRLDLRAGLEAWLSAAICHNHTFEAPDAAADFGLSLRSFQRLLTELGLSYATLRNQVRQRMSRTLLSETTLPVTEIGQRLGYSETSAFSRAFRTLEGISPAQFRAQLAS